MQYERSDQTHVPLYEALSRHHAHDPVSFHVPGHKSSVDVYGEAARDFERIVSLDRTELPGLDDLHDPHGVIEQAQQLAAEAYGALHTFFLVGGSTSGNMAMILSLCQPDDILIVQRDVHQSVIHALMLARAKAVFIHPQIHPEYGLSQGPQLADIEFALQQYPEAKGVLLNYPSYYGVCFDLKAVAELVHRYDKPLLVDEAHGAHFHFHPQLPASALECGADAVVQSTHKMLGALTMGAMLHIASQRLDQCRVQQVLSWIQSSSPSYPIMASLDLSRRDMVLQGTSRIEQVCKQVDELRLATEEHDWLGVATGALHSEWQDPFKLVLFDKSGSMSGYELLDALREQGCYAELADPRYVLLVFSPYTKKIDLERLRLAWHNIGERLSECRQELQKGKENIYILDTADAVSHPVRFDAQPIDEAWEMRQVPKHEAIGKESAHMITPYPPGIPLLYPGERLTPQVMTLLEEIQATGGRIRGIKDSSLQTYFIRYKKY